MENSAKPDSLDAETLEHILRQLPAASSVKTWWLAYSGGIDSRVLLHLLSRLTLNLQAVYVDHGLQPDSREWGEHCRQSCAELGVPFRVVEVDVAQNAGDGPEAAARRARYSALAGLMQFGDCLLTAQHRDDQAETLLLQLLRGGGAAGLAGMPLYSRFAGGWHMRPLLRYSRTDITACARGEGLSWVEDPSNRSSHYDRNFLRNHILPALKQRWPAVDRTLAVAAEQQAENARLLDQLAQLDYQKLQVDDGSLPVDGLADMDDARLRNMLRYWILRQGHRTPPRQVLQQILQQMFTPRKDADPRVHWAGSELRRYRGRLYLMADADHDPAGVHSWDGQRPLELSGLKMALRLEARESEGLRGDLVKQGLRVCFRQGGETLKPAGRNGHHSLKKLFQEAGVPPWLRDRIPLIYLGRELIAVAGYWIAEGYACAPGERGLLPVLEKH